MLTAVIVNASFHPEVVALSGKTEFNLRGIGYSVLSEK